tara:strand:- start:20971 stop:21150 length:180 start_codon:yes stop_codon:yes gene_type:complete
MNFESMSPQLRKFYADKIEREWYSCLTPEVKPVSFVFEKLWVSPTHFVSDFGLGFDEYL